jgi:hypothetical protein
LPLYNVVVYVPNAAVDPITDGVTCDTCQTGLSGDPIAAALSDTKGEFILKDVPAGANIPLVITIGKWRREVVIPNVMPCVDNQVTPDLTRLPKNQSEGHIPRIAMVTGGADALECLLRKIGLEDSEFTPENGPGRINLFAGKDGGNKFTPDLNGGTVFPNGKNLWDDAFKLKNYDLVLMNCEGGTDAGNKSAQRPPERRRLRQHRRAPVPLALAKHLDRERRRPVADRRDLRSPARPQGPLHRQARHRASPRAWPSPTG